MISKVVKFPDIKRETQFSLVSPIDKSNKNIIESLEKYIKENRQAQYLYNAYSNDRVRDNFIFGNVNIDDDICAEQVYDIAFLTDGKEIIGHIISVFNISFFGGIKRLHSTIVMEQFIPFGYDSLKLIENYRKKRILLSSEKQYFMHNTLDLTGGVTR